MGTARIIQGALMGVAVAVLVGAAAVVGAPDDLAADAEALVRSFYATQDPQLVIDHLVEGSVPDDPQTTASIQEGLAGLLAQPAEIVSTEVVAPLGHELAMVEMSADAAGGQGFRWCVDRDQRVLLSCVVGEVTLEATVEGAPLDVVRASLGAFADEFQLILVLLPRGQNPRPYTLRGEPTITLADGGRSPFELDGAFYVAPDGSGEPADEPLRLRAGRGLAFDYRASDTSDRRVFESDAEVTWEGGSIQISVASATWFIG